MYIIKVTAMVAFGLFVVTTAATADAADKSAGSTSIGSQFPNTANNLQVILFALKDKKISLSISAQEFCGKLDYGEAVFWERPDEIKDHTVVPGNLNWVICKFKGK